MKMIAMIMMLIIMMVMPMMMIVVMTMIDMVMIMMTQIMMKMVTVMNDGHKMYSGATATHNCYGTGAIRPRPAGAFEERRPSILHIRPKIICLV